ncbi:MAG: hypothetical protein A3J83_03710, partial [Elusimicrobia bacterium RIFOXYA2_FULL_40_6]
MEPKKSVLDGKKFSKYFLLAVFVLSMFIFLSMIRFFVMQILISIIIATLIYPLFKFFLKITKNRRALASLLCCAVILISLLIPLVFISQILVVQSIELYHTAGPQINEIIQKGNEGIIGEIMTTPLGGWLSSHNIELDWQSLLEKVLSFSGTTLATFINTTSRFTVEAVFSFFIIMFSLFYFLRDGENILLKIKDVIPMTEEYKDRIIFRFYTMSNAMVKGILLIAFIQSSLATFTLWIFGIKAWLLWGLVMMILAVIPFVGTGVVLVPAGIIKIISGDILQGIAMIIISMFFISVIDNFLRPRIVGQHAGMHDLL